MATWYGGFKGSQLSPPVFRDAWGTSDGKSSNAWLSSRSAAATDAASVGGVSTASEAPSGRGFGSCHVSPSTIWDLLRYIFNLVSDKRSTIWKSSVCLCNVVITFIPITYYGMFTMLIKSQLMESSELSVVTTAFRLVRVRERCQLVLSIIWRAASGTKIHRYILSWSWFPGCRSNNTNSPISDSVVCHQGRI